MALLRKFAKNGSELIPLTRSIVCLGSGEDSDIRLDDAGVPEIAAQIGTPFYLYSHATLKRHYTKFDQAFDGLERLVCFSAKANASLAILKLLNSLGTHLNRCHVQIGRIEGTHFIVYRQRSSRLKAHSSNATAS